MPQSWTRTILGAAGGVTLAGQTFTGVSTFSGDALFKSGRPWIDVRAYGAVGDGITDDTIAIQNAINALDNGASIAGTIYFPPAVASGSQIYLVSSALTVGDGTKFVEITLVGAPHYSASAAPAPLSQIRSTSATADILVLKAPASRSHSFYINGLQLVYNGASTGAAIHVTGSGQMAGLVIENSITQGGGSGLLIDTTSINIYIRNATFMSATNGVQIAGGANLTQFTNVYFQSNTVGLLITSAGGLSTPTFNGCVFQSNSGPGVKLNGIITRAAFIGCWWEFPGSDMIQLATASMTLSVFVGCIFDGSAGVGGRNVFNNLGAAASAVVGSQLTFIGGQESNLNGGAFMTIGTDPTNSNDPGYIDVTLIGFSSADSIKGLHTSNSAFGPLVSLGYQNYFPSQVTNSSVYSIKPPYFILNSRSGAGTNVPLRTVLARAVATYGVAVAVDASLANEFDVTATNGTAFTVSNPTNSVAGQRITITIRNTSGGVLGAVTWDTLYKLAAWTSPANANSRSIDFRFDGTNWVEVGRTPNDVPN